MNSNCIFCRIVTGEIPSYPVWESSTHIAFLTPTPNTPGFTVVIPKQHWPSDLMALPEAEYSELLLAARSAATAIQRGLDVGRVGLVAEGMGVDHAHVKLIPMHGLDKDWKPVEARETSYAEKYQGFLTTHEGPTMPKERLEAIQKRILGG